MDCSIIPTRFPNLYQISTTDFFFPLVEDPYIQGRIACANVLSDLYAEGVVHCDNMLMLMGVCDSMPVEQRDVVTRRMMEGFADTAREAGTRVTGGQTVINGWPLVGGVAISVVEKNEFIEPIAAQPGDILVLTKPLGIQVAVNLHQWIDEGNANHEKLVRMEKEGIFKVNEAETIFRNAVTWMCKLNKNGAKLMHKYGAHCATDVTGFGILGHAKALALNQKKKGIEFRIDTLPVIQGVRRAVDALGMFKGLMAGTAAETSGGLLVCLPGGREKAIEFCKELGQLEGLEVGGWIVGEAVEVEGSSEKGTARLADKLEFIDV